MDERILKSLFDIKLAIEEIDSFLLNEEKTFSNYSKNTLLKRGIERNLEIIGEAVNRILKENTEFEITNARRIIGLRNQIIHAYDSISDENIWSIVVKHIPNLKIEIEDKINNSTL
ncbi:DUF86 domain-containing protein [Flavobacterium sp. KACC 22761]|uniref:HepT-like ribonuclease domain-containing protein n=1 Tax=Flavobacterium sp. KACC 22761 TaxID=3092665 RepID=UPI002A756730|nr:HepT-like ribonuclease domain-containing protein [Flavobacterium sp. KACC 22761]WPO80311.1 HepT-like ribonuclease domain-containing protein [Flavobacterium sp. KACC 22761]